MVKVLCCPTPPSNPARLRWTFLHIWHPDSFATTWAHHTLLAFNLQMAIFSFTSQQCPFSLLYLLKSCYFKTSFKCHQKQISDPLFPPVFHSQITMYCCVCLASVGNMLLRSCPSHSSWNLSQKVLHIKHWKMCLGIGISLLVSELFQCLESKPWLRTWSRFYVWL